MAPLLGDDTEYLSLFEIARKFHLSPETVRLWVVRGILVNGQRVTLAGRKIGGSWRIAVTDLIDFVRENMDTKRPHIPAPRTDEALSDSLGA